MFWDAQNYSTTSLTDSDPFPIDLNDTWSKATTDLYVTAEGEAGSEGVDNNFTNK